MSVCGCKYVEGITLKTFQHIVRNFQHEVKSNLVSLYITQLGKISRHRKVCKGNVHTHGLKIMNYSNCVRRSSGTLSLVWDML